MSNFYIDYKRVRNFVWEFILKECIASLPIDVLALCKSNGIIVKTYTDGAGYIALLGLKRVTKETDGFTSVLFGKRIIFYNDTTATARQRFTIAHELGHILLGHISGKKILKRSISKWNSEGEPPNPQEAEANIFASRLLAPLCVLKEKGVQSTDEVMDLTGLSREAAGYRFERLQEMIEKGQFYKHPLERKVIEQFRDFINGR